MVEEAADEVRVHYDPATHRVITMDVLNFSARVQAAFGPTLTYTGRTDPQRLEGLHGLPLRATFVTVLRDIGVEIGRVAHPLACPKGLICLEK